VPPEPASPNQGRGEGVWLRPRAPGRRRCAEPDLLILDEPTSGLDPIVRREFVRTVIGAYQEGGRGPRTVFVSTHLISEFEGLIDEFTIIEKGREVLTLDVGGLAALAQVFPPPDPLRFGLAFVGTLGIAAAEGTSRPSSGRVCVP
jgi:energy-coupling factor transporter ATP-binding protein EcfA2